MRFHEVRGGASLSRKMTCDYSLGLWQCGVVDPVTVAWPSGRTETFQQLRAGHLYTIVEGEGVKEIVSFQPGRN